MVFPSSSKAHEKKEIDSMFVVVDRLRFSRTKVENRIRESKQNIAVRHVDVEAKRYAEEHQYADTKLVPSPSPVRRRHSSISATW